MNESINQSINKLIKYQIKNTHDTRRLRICNTNIWSQWVWAFFWL